MLAIRPWSLRASGCRTCVPVLVVLLLLFAAELERREGPGEIRERVLCAVEDLVEYSADRAERLGYRVSRLLQEPTRVLAERLPGSGQRQRLGRLFACMRTGCAGEQGWGNAVKPWAGSDTSFWRLRAGTRKGLDRLLDVPIQKCDQKQQKENKGESHTSRTLRA